MFGLALREVSRQAVRLFGDGLEVTLRRRGTLRNKVSGDSISSLTLANAASGGATAVDLTAANLKGELPAGAVLTIAGVSGSYTTTAAAEANAAGQLLAVAVTPALAGPGAQGAAVTVTQSYAEQVYQAMRSEATEENLDGVVEGTVRAYVLVATGTERAAALGDLLFKARAVIIKSSACIVLIVRRKRRQ